jgi:glyoxylase-like metal-dependent hydrolase (beta-lactamase superfamily II)
MHDPTARRFANVHGLARVLCAALCLAAMAAHPGAASGAESGATTKATKGLVIGSDGFTYYYDQSGQMVKGKYVRIDDKTIYYFAQSGRGIKQFFQVHNDRLIQFWNIGGRTTCFLVIGDKEALFIDGLFGMGHLHELASFFTDKPVSLAISHGSVDHSGAAYAYKEFKAVYLNQLDEPALIYFGKSPYRRFTNDVIESKPTAKFDYYDVLSVDDYLSYPVDMHYTDLKDGMTFDLGEMTVEAMWTPGHSRGCTTFLIKEMKTLISGCAGVSTQISFTTIEDYRQQTVLKLIARQKEWNKVYSLHGPMVAEGTAIPPEVFEKLLATCDGLLRGTIKGVPTAAAGNQIYGGKPGQMTTAGVLGREQSIGNLMYDPSKILNAQD